MTRLVCANRIRVFDNPDFTPTLRERVREAAASLTAEAGIPIEYVSTSHIREEAIVTSSGYSNGFAA
jgi:hypothetical protein